MQAERSRTELPPSAIIVMGVSGCGKSTLAARLAAELHCPFLEGDSFHAPASIAKMQAGQPLNDADRWPWLDRIGAALGTAIGTDRVAVAACSALRRRYRDRLVAATGMPLLFVLLNGERDVLLRRLEARRDHYMPPCLLDSQLATLERPGSDEHALVLPASAPPEALVRIVRDRMGGEQSGRGAPL